MFLEGCDGNRLLHSEQFIVKRKNINKPHILEFFVPFVSPHLPNYILSFVSENGYIALGKALLCCLT